ncbi:MAG: Na+/H+ antiporter subunit G [Planctomycetes bacterium]|nr:Na+/H+ antiporter subunit G [Planctomycetota bacterium]
MSSALAVLGYILFSVGILVNLFGCIGLVRMPDVYNRLQAATKCVTLGTCSVLLATALVAQTGSIAWKAIICACFILLTSPTGAHAIAKGSYLSGIPLWGKVTDAYGPSLEARGIHPARGDEEGRGQDPCEPRS